MIKIKRGEHCIEVSKLTYEKMFKKLGYEIVTSKKAETRKKPETKKVEIEELEIKE